jgi:recombination protein RecA
MVKKAANNTTTTKKNASVISAIKKKYSEGVKIGAFMAAGPVDVLSSGSLTLDIATGVGGAPRGGIIEISGQESSAKTTLCLKLVKDAQRRGYTVAYIDTEWALDPTWVETQGVKVHPDDPSKGMIILNADSLEKAGEISVMLAKSGEFNLIVFDSIAGAPIEAQLEGDIGDANMGKRAKILSTFLPKLNGPVRENGVWFVFTNQLRYSMAMYGDQFVAPGGKAVPFHSIIRIQVSGKKEKTAQGVDPSYTTISGRVIKNKVAPPFKTFEFNLGYTDGQVDEGQEVADLLTDSKNLELLGIQRSGAFYTLPREIVPAEYDELRFQGAAKVLDMLMSDMEFLRTKVIPYIRTKLILHEDQGNLEHRGLKADVVSEDDEEYGEEE